MDAPAFQNSRAKCRAKRLVDDIGMPGRELRHIVNRDRVLRFLHWNLHCIYNDMSIMRKFKILTSITMISRVFNAIPCAQIATPQLGDKDRQRVIALRRKSTTHLSLLLGLILIVRASCKEQKKAWQEKNPGQLYSWHLISVSLVRGVPQERSPSL
jgi:hypothetical protein